MKKDLFMVQKQSGKVVIVSTGNGSKGLVNPLKDTVYYQVGGNGDYVQERN
jgi:hypothetical protein